MRDWLKVLPPLDRKHIGEDSKTVEFGWPISMAVCKTVRNGIYEVRTNLIPNRIARVLFYIDKKGRMVLFYGFIKKTQKTPEEDSELASNDKNKHQRALRVKGMKMKRRRSHRVTNHDGSTFDSFLEEQGIREEVAAVAIKRVLLGNWNESCRNSRRPNSRW